MPARRDWHAADIVAALHKKGRSLAGLSRANAGGQALVKPWPALERIIAAEIGASPESIWPSRYLADGTPKRERNGRKSITGGSRRNVHTTAAA